MGWNTISDGKRLVSSAEFRSLILEGSDEFQSKALWSIKSYAKDDEEWGNKVLEFLRDVWPKQKTIRTPEMSGSLVELALAQKKKFPEVAAIVSTLVTKIGNKRIFLSELRNTDKTVAGQHPEAMLNLLYAILSDDKSRWPYGAEAALSTLAEKAPALRSDVRFYRTKSALLTYRTAPNASVLKYTGIAEF